MIRLLLTVFLLIVAIFIYGYLDELNPTSVTVRLTPRSTFDISLVYLVFVSMMGGAFLVALLVGVRETKHRILNWRNARLRRREEKAESLYREGTHAFLSKRTAEAIELFQKALALDPDHTSSLLWLGNVYRAEKNYPEAIRLHRRARITEERNVEVLLALAKDLECAKRFEEALQTLQEALKLDQANLTAQMYRRELYIRLEKWSDALEVQERLMKANLSESDQRTESHLLVGLTYEVGRQLLGRGHPDKARHYFRAAIKRDKNFLPAYIGLADILVQEDKSRQAAEILEKVYIKTRNVIILHRLEELYLELGEPGEILRIYQEAIQRDPQNPVLKFYLGKLYYRLEMVDEAFNLLSTLEGPQDQTSDFHKIMANLYLRKQQMEDAVEELKKALAFRKRVVVPYACTHCHFESIEWSGRCRQCGLWNTYVALPWVDPTQQAPHRDEQAPAVPYQEIASPFEIV